MSNNIDVLREKLFRAIRKKEKVANVFSKKKIDKLKSYFYPTRKGALTYPKDWSSEVSRFPVRNRLKMRRNKLLRSFRRRREIGWGLKVNIEAIA